MKIVLQLLIACLLALGLSNFTQYRPNETAINVLYTVSGILFSVGLGLIITLVPNGIKHQGYIKQIRQTINKVRNRFFVEFTIATLLFVVFNKPEHWSIVQWQVKEWIILFDPIIASSATIFLSLPYFVFNFLSMQKLNNDIFDKVLAEGK